MQSQVEGRNGGSVMRHVERLSEPVIIPDTYVSGLSHIEELDGGDTLRFTFYAQRQSIYGDGSEYTVEARLILSKQAVWQALKLTLFTFGIRCVGAVCPQSVQKIWH